MTQNSSDKPLKLPNPRQMIGYFGAFFVLGMLIASLGPSLPYLAENVGVAIADAGVLFSVRSLGYMLGSLFLGRLYDRLPGNRLLTALLLLVALMTALVPLSPWLALLSALLFISGLCLGGIDVGSNTLVIWLFGKRAGPYLNALFFFGGLGGLVIPLIVGWCVGSGIGVRWAYWIMAAVVLVVAIWVIAQPSPERKAQNETTRGQPLNLPLVALFGALFFLYVGIETSYGGWIYTYTLSNGLGDVTRAAYINSLFWLALTVGRLVAIPIATRVRPLLIMRANLLGALASLGLMLVFPYTPAVIAIGTAGLGLSLASTIPASLSIAERRMHITGRLTGMLWAIGSLGAFVTPWMVGQLMARFSPIALQVTLMVYVALALGIVGIIGLRFRRLNDLSE